MFKKIKKLFEAEKEPEEINLNSDEVLTWLTELEENRFEDVKNKIEDKLKRIKKSQKSCEKQLEDLKNAQLKNDNIPKKEEHMMIGHKESFSKRTIGFLLDTECEITSPEELFKWTKEIEDNIDRLAKTNAKSSYVLNEFFGDQMRILNKEIASIGNIVKEIKNVLVDSGFVDIEELREKANELIEKEKAKIELEKQYLETKKKCDKIDEQIINIENKINEIKKSNDFQALEKLKNDRESFKKEKEGYKKKFTEDIKSIETGLKRYKRMSMDEKLISEYISNPVKTLLKDEDLKILEIISKLYVALNTDKIELKIKKKEKVLENLKIFEARYVKSMQNNYKRAVEQKQKIELKLNRNPVMQNLREENYMLEHLKTKQKTSEIELDIKKKALSKIGIDSVKKNMIKIAKRMDMILHLS